MYVRFEVVCVLGDERSTIASASTEQEALDRQATFYKNDARDRRIGYDVAPYRYDVERVTYDMDAEDFDACMESAPDWDMTREVIAVGE